MVTLPASPSRYPRHHYVTRVNVTLFATACRCPSFAIGSAIRDDELEHVKTMFACERGTGDLISPNLAAATPRWAEDAPSMPSSSQAVASGEFTALRSDIRRNTPLDVYLAGRNLIDRGGRKKGKRKKQAGTRDSSSAHVADDHDGVPGAEAEDREGPSGVQAELDGGKAEGQEEMGK